MEASWLVHEKEFVAVQQHAAGGGERVFIGDGGEVGGFLRRGFAEQREAEGGADLVGGAGADTLTGGLGSDTFRYLMLIQVQWILLLTLQRVLCYLVATLLILLICSLGRELLQPI